MDEDLESSSGMYRTYPYSGRTGVRIDQRLALHVLSLYQPFETTLPLSPYKKHLRYGQKVHLSLK